MLSQWVSTFLVSPGFCLFSLKRGFLFHILLSHKNLLTSKCERETHSSLHSVYPRSGYCSPLRTFKPPDELPITHSPWRGTLLCFQRPARERPCWAGWRKCCRLIGTVELLTFSQCTPAQGSWLGWLEEITGGGDQDGGWSPGWRVEYRRIPLIKTPIKPCQHFFSHKAFA